MRKKMIAAAFAVLGCALIGIGGTYAAFTDTETPSPALVQAGRLDLTLSAGDGSMTQPVTFSNLRPEAAPAPGTYRPSEHFYFVRLTNGGTLPGRALWATSGVAELENGCNEPEVKADDLSCGTATGEGELGDQLRVSFSLLPGAECTGNPGVVPPEQYPATSGLDFREIKPGGKGNPLVLAPGATRCVRVDVYFPQWPNNNLAQTDSSAFRLAFRLDQTA